MSKEHFSFEYDRLFFKDFEKDSKELIEASFKYFAQDFWGETVKEFPVDTGRGQGSFNLEFLNPLLAQIYTNVHYVPYVYYGTGIHGPAGREIKPKNAKALAFSVKGGGQVFAKSSQGQRPNKFFDRANDNVSSKVDSYMQKALSEF